MTTKGAFLVVISRGSFKGLVKYPVTSELLISGKYSLFFVKYKFLVDFSNMNILSPGYVNSSLRFSTVFIVDSLDVEIVSKDWNKSFNK